MECASTQLFQINGVPRNWSVKQFGTIIGFDTFCRQSFWLWHESLLAVDEDVLMGNT